MIQNSKILQSFIVNQISQNNYDTSIKQDKIDVSDTESIDNEFVHIKEVQYNINKQNSDNLGENFTQYLEHDIKGVVDDDNDNDDNDDDEDDDDEDDADADNDDDDDDDDDEDDEVNDLFERTNLSNIDINKINSEIQNDIKDLDTKIITLDNEIVNELDNEIDNEIDNELDNEIDNEIDNELDNELDNEIDNDLVLDISVNVSNNLENGQQISKRSLHRIKIEELRTIVVSQNLITNDECMKLKKIDIINLILENSNKLNTKNK
jgi:hypothetical protein